MCDQVAPKMAELLTSELELSPLEAYKLTSTFLGGSWTKCGEGDIEIKTFGSGFSNSLFFVENKRTSDELDENDKDVPSQVLIRKYGGKVVEDGEDYKSMAIEAEVLVYAKLGELALGPKILGIFDAGRIEEFIPSHTLNDEDLMNKNIRLDIARKLARIHCMKFPISKEPLDQIWHIEKKLKDFTPESLLERKNLQGCKIDLNEIAHYDFATEIEWMKTMVSHVGGRNTFCINDMNRLNCLIMDKPDAFGERVMLIDYEFAAYGPRGLDIGNHFHWRTRDLTSETFLSRLDYPTEELQKEFIEEYLKTISKTANYELDSNGVDSVEHVLMEAHFYGLLYTLFLGVWILRPTKSALKLPSGLAEKFMGLTKKQLSLYQKGKKMFEKKYHF